MKSILFIMALACPYLGHGQAVADNQEILDRIADELLATAEADVSYEELYETLTHLLANPVDLNRVTTEQLRAVFILNESEISAFIEYRNAQGNLLSVLELQAIPGWSTETVRRLLPFVYVHEPGTRMGPEILRRMARERNQYAVMRYERTLEERPAYKTADSARRYAGNPDRYYFRYRLVKANDFSLGVTAEKDPGEKVQWSPSTGMYGFDFYSGHLQLMRKGRLENLVMGDFQCQFGQGLQLGSVFGLGKTAQTITGIRRSNLGFLPYVSASESFYLRGVAATLRIVGPVRLHAFASSKSADALVDSGEPVISALQTSGLHRTTREISARGQANDRDLGVILQYRNTRLDAGIVAHRKNLSHALAPSATPYNQFRFAGLENTNLGGFLNFDWFGVTLFAEYARSLGHGSALTAGFLGNLTRKMEMAWLVRNYDVDYYASFANALSEGSVPQNEQGIYWGVKYTFSKRLSIQGYVDYFRFPWLRYRAYKPSDGTECLFRFDFTPSRATRFYLQAREEVKLRNLPGEGNLYATGPGTRRNLWVGGEFELAPGLSVKTRIQASRFELGSATTQGLAIAQEATWKRERFSVSIRYALFDTDDYENRQYLYEKDVWLATSLPAFEGKGFRNCVLVHYAVTRWLDVWLRWSRTRYVDREVIGSGLEQIDGNARNDVKFQVRIRP